MKYCKKCSTEKAESEFYFRNGKYLALCKSCEKARTAKHAPSKVGTGPTRYMTPDQMKHAKWLISKKIAYAKVASRFGVKGPTLNSWFKKGKFDDITWDVEDEEKFQYELYNANRPPLPAPLPAKMTVVAPVYSSESESDEPIIEEVVESESEDAYDELTSDSEISEILYDSFEWFEELGSEDSE